VLDVDAATATVTIGSRTDLLRGAARVVGLTFAAGSPPPAHHELLLQVRAHGTPVAGWLDGDVVRFATPQPRVAPGQVVAFYDGDILLGGGIAAA
jgi:tRNA-specific 2-thiouridylase